MRKILIRAGMSPLETPDIDQVLQNDRIGGNSGNLIYQYSVFRALMTEDTQFTSRYFRIDNCDEAFIEEVNSSYECVILPLANVFRPGYGERMRQIAAFIRQMKIPCVVIGCGLQANTSAQIDAGFPFDAAAKELVSAVLEKSAMLGLRGELTAKYLQKLGFAPERHFTVTGCPSMFTRGLHLPAPRVGGLTEKSRISINTKLKQPRQINELMTRAIAAHPDYHLVSQMPDELALLRYGMPVIGNSLPGRDGNRFYPRTDMHSAVRNGRATAFLSARAWHEYMREKDFSFGSRIHGNIAAVLSGTPALVITTDTRTEELCRYHNIQFMPAAEVKSGMDIRDIYEKRDFGSVQRGHAERFAHFVDFLNANSLTHAYAEDPAVRETPFDRAVAQLPLSGRLTYEPVSLQRRLQGAYAAKAFAGKVRRKILRKIKG